MRFRAIRLARDGFVVSFWPILRLLQALPAAGQAGHGSAKKTPAKPKADAESKPRRSRHAKPNQDAKAKATTPEKTAATEAIAANSYAAIPLTERVAIQNDLIWTGDYNGTVGGDFGERRSPP